MKRTLTLLLLCIAVAVTAFAAQKPGEQATKPPAGMPTVDQILDKYVQALGGKAAIEKVSSTITKGTFDLPAMGVSGTLEIYAKAPNKNATIINLPGFGVVQLGFNGTLAWAQDPQTGMRELSGSELADTKRDSEFYKEIKLKQLYPKITWASAKFMCWKQRPPAANPRRCTSTRRLACSCVWMPIAKARKAQLMSKPTSRTIETRAV